MEDNLIDNKLSEDKSKFSGDNKPYFILQVDGNGSISDTASDNLSIIENESISDATSGNISIIENDQNINDQNMNNFNTQNRNIPVYISTRKKKTDPIFKTRVLKTIKRSNKCIQALALPTVANIN